MSATIEQLTPTKIVQQRTANATTSLKQMLKLEDLKLLSAAVAEAAADEAKHNPRFAEKIRTIYQELPPPKNKRAERSTPHVHHKLVPIGKVEGYEFNPFGPIDPEYLFKVYGADQLPLALEDYTLVRLKEAAEIIMQQHPGTKPKNMSKKADVIAYIVEMVTGKH
jgi:hypothetical protein